MGGDKDFTQTTVGTPYYMSPEMYKGLPYDLSTDVWAMGCVLYELCTGKHAFDAKNLFDLAAKIQKANPANLPSTFSPALNQLMRDMLQADMKRRPTMVSTNLYRCLYFMQHRIC